MFVCAFLSEQAEELRSSALGYTTFMGRAVLGFLKYLHQKTPDGDDVDPRGWSSHGLLLLYGFLPLCLTVSSFPFHEETVLQVILAVSENPPIKAHLWKSLPIYAGMQCCVSWSMKVLCRETERLWVHCPVTFKKMFLSLLLCRQPNNLY